MPLSIGKRGQVEIDHLVTHPLLLVDRTFVSRRSFDATCRLAGVSANIVVESRTPHTLLAMAERGHGVAVVSSAVQIDRYKLRVVRVTYRGEPLREPLAIFWDMRRPLPRYAQGFCEMLAQHVREVFPITKPSTARIVLKRRTMKRSR